MISRVPVTTNGAIGDSIYVGLLAPRAPTDPEFGLPLYPACHPNRCIGFEGSGLQSLDGFRKGPPSSVRTVEALGLSREANSMIAGEYITHYCPPQQAGSDWEDPPSAKYLKGCVSSVCF